jgi:exopolyphosphatase/guanosine-5'-triphosphate,3'-diphosphate pyrophosphatase
MNRYGVIDLGTNTFHLLIVDVNETGETIELFRERIFVKLAEDGIGEIGKKAYSRGLQALSHFQKILLEHQVKNINALGTAALRTASNGLEFIKAAKAASGISIQLIPGSEEARLIHVGVTRAIEFGDEKGLIMDIGGGSVEFIIADKNEVFWAESFPIGVAVLHNNFHQEEPISVEEIEILHAHLERTLQPLFDVLKNHKTTSLIGASGTFDVLENILPNTQKTKLSATIEVANFYPTYQKILDMNMEERRAEESIPLTRADMIVVALILIDFILKRTEIKKILVSAYAMKEGILWEMRKG